MSMKVSKSRMKVWFAVAMLAASGFASAKFRRALTERLSDGSYVRFQICCEGTECYVTWVEE